jgi:hypothetical protein
MLGSSSWMLYAPQAVKGLDNEPRKNYRLIGKNAGCAPVFGSYTLAFALQLRKKHEKTSVRVVTDVLLGIKTLSVSMTV